jgi:hypothetical protein
LNFAIFQSCISNSLTSAMEPIPRPAGKSLILLKHL